MTTPPLTLVTGATGFIGRRLREPHHRALVRTSTGRGNEVVGDLLDPPSLAHAVVGVSAVIHCAGVSDADAANPSFLWRINVDGTRNLATAAANAGVNRFVMLSSVKAMAEPGTECVDESWPGAPTTPYGQSKRAAEEVVREIGARSGMEVVILRPAPVYGRGCRGLIATLVRLVAQGWFPQLPETGNRRSWLHVADLIQAIHLAATHPAAAGQTFIVAHPTPLSTLELADLIRAALALPPPRVRVPLPLLRLAQKIPGRIGRLVERLTASACYLPTHLEATLGWRAQVDFPTGFAEMVGRCDLLPTPPSPL